MFEDLKSELSKLESAVQTAFSETKGGVAQQKTLIETLDADLLSPFDRLEAAAKKAESMVKSRLDDVRAAVERLVT